MANFKRGLDPKDALNVGQKGLVVKWLQEKGITNAQIEKQTNQDGSVVYNIDVDGDVYLKDFHLDDVASIPENIRFRNVSGCFILEKTPPQRIDPRPIEGAGDVKMKLNVGMINETRKWLKKYTIENTFIERNTGDGSPVFFVDVDEDVVLWDMHLNDVPNLPDYFRFRHISGRVLLCNGNRMYYHKHQLLKALISMAEKDVQEKNIAAGQVRVKKVQSSLRAEVKGNLVLKEPINMLDSVPLDYYPMNGHVTILGQLSKDEIVARLKRYARELLDKQAIKSTAARQSLEHLFSDRDEYLDNNPMLFGFLSEPGSRYKAPDKKSPDQLAKGLMDALQESGLSQKDEYGVDLNEYLVCLERMKNP